MKTAKLAWLLNEQHVTKQTSRAEDRHHPFGDRTRRRRCGSARTPQIGGGTADAGLAAINLGLGEMVLRAESESSRCDLPGVTAHG